MQELKEKLEKTERQLETLQAKKSEYEGKLTIIEERRQEVINSLKEMGVNKPSDVGVVKGNLEKEINSFLVEIENLINKLPEDIKNEVIAIN